MISEDILKQNVENITAGGQNYEVNADIESEIDVEMGKNPDRWSGKVEPIDKRYIISLCKTKKLTAAEVLKELVQAHRECQRPTRELNYSSDLDDLDKAFELIRNIFLKMELCANSALIDVRNEGLNQEDRLKKELNNYKLQFDTLQASKTDLEAVISSQASEIKSLKIQLGEKTTETKKLSLEISENEKTLSNYRKWLENNENKVKELENEILRLNLLSSKNKQLENNIQDKCRIIKDNEFEIGKLKKEMESQKSELEKRKAGMDELKSILSAKDVEKDKAVFEATKHLEIKIGVLEAMLKPPSQSNQ